MTADRETLMERAARHVQQPQPACEACRETGLISTRKVRERQCAECGEPVCADHTFIRVDEANESITRNSPPFCGACADRLEPRR